MWMPIILLIIGLLLVYAEFFLPGGIMGVTGGIMIFVAIFTFAQESSNIAYVLIFLGAAILGLITVVRLALKQIREGKGSKGIYLSEDQEGFRASEFDESMVGKRGTALSDLRPAGHVSLEGKRYQAVSRTGYIEKDSEVEAIAGEGAHLIVKLVNEEQ